MIIVLYSLTAFRIRRAWGAAIGIELVDPRDIVQHPAVHKGAPTTKDCASSNVNSVEVQKL